MINQKLAEIFYKIADILEIKKVKWKPQAYRIAAQTIEGLKKDVSEIYAEKGIGGLKEIPGIGEGLAKKIIQYIEIEKIDEYEKLKSSIPYGLYEMMDIPGVGAKKASLFYESGIKNISKLKKAAETHRLLKLPGFKEKSEENILKGIELFKKKKERISFEKAEALAEKIIKELKKIKEAEEVLAAGSLRRKKSTIGDIDIVVKTNNAKKVFDKYVKMPFVKEVLGKGKEKATIITKENIQVDVRVFTEAEFGAGLLYFTGDKQHNIWLRKIAIKKGFLLNEYGLFKGKKRIAGKTEEDIYKALSLSYIEPEKRIGEVKN